MGVTQTGYFPDDLVKRYNVKNAEASSTLAAGKLAYFTSAFEVKIAGADDPPGLVGIAETDIAAGASGYVLVRGITTVLDLDALNDGDILAPAAAGALVAVDGHQERRIAQVLVKASDVLYVNGLGI
jgi:hypothetical protein